MTAKKEFARILPAAPFGNEVDKLDLKELLEKTRAENESLKGDLFKTREELERYKTLEQARLSLEKNPPVPAASGGLSLPSSESVRPTAKKAEGKPGINTNNASEAPGPRRYSVQEGDTLSIISKKFYGQSNKWKEIAEANKSTLPDPRKLKLGQELIIP